MKVKIISGTYGYRPAGSTHPIPVDRGNTCDVSAEEASRLFALGVAESAEDIPATPPKEGESGVATPPNGDGDNGAGVNTPNSESAAEGQESSSLDPEQLKELTNAKLTELAKEIGIDTAKLKTKAQLIAAIANVPLEDAISESDDGADNGDNDPPPALAPENPVV